MLTMALLALAIFVVFAVVGGGIVLWIIRNAPDDGDEPPRGFPRDN